LRDGGQSPEKELPAKPGAQPLQGRAPGRYRFLGISRFLHEANSPAKPETHDKTTRLFTISESSLYYFQVTLYIYFCLFCHKFKKYK
jgi:hypothetical protein